MIIARLIGGLGNQMFQYACGSALAARHNVPLKLDLRGFEKYPLRNYLLDRFQITAPPAEPDELPTLSQVSSPFVRILPKLYRPHGLRICREYKPTFDPQFFSLGPNLYLDGYWQSEKYFNAVAAELRQQFHLRNPLDPVSLSQSDAIQKNISISLHIRRGDYVNHPLYVNCTPEYYRRGIDYIAERNPGARLYIFSDDPNWVRKNLVTQLPATYIEQNQGVHDEADLVLMSQCRHHIIANSSFSWWGAWCGTNPDGIVIAPNAWYTDASKVTSDLLPDRWVQLPV